MKNKPFILFLIITLLSVLVVGGVGVFAYTQGVVSVQTDNLLIDGNMEGDGMSGWITGTAAWSYKVSTTTPHSGKQVMRVVATGGGSNTYVRKDIALTVGKKYRVTGFARALTDGTRPRFYNGTTLWTGSSGTETKDWQYFDITFNSLALQIRLYGSGTTLGEIVEFDDVTITAVTTGDIKNPSVRLFGDGNMERTGTASYLPYSSAVITKRTDSPHGGKQYLRVAYGGENYPFAYTSGLMTIGKKYRITGYMRGDGVNGKGYLDNGGGGPFLWYGTTANEWQYFDVTFIALDNEIRLQNYFTGDGYTDWDDIAWIEVTTGDITNPSKNILIDGNMERSGMTGWSVIGSASKVNTSPHSGKQAIRITNVGSTGSAYRSGQTRFKKYRVTGFFRSDGTAIPRYTDSAGILGITGTASTEWQFFNWTYEATGINMVLQKYGTDGEWVEFDDVVVYQLD